MTDVLIYTCEWRCQHRMVYHWLYIAWIIVD